MSKKKICTWPELKARLWQDRARKRRIVFTNGCFDLIHLGHLKVFESCKKHGDVLVVGLNSDSSVRRLKGPKRPLVGQEHRAQLLAGFEVVDYVTVFNELTPEKLIKKIKPDVLVKGGDWKAGQIVGREFANKVVRVPLVKGQSTTRLIQLIIRRYG